MLFLRGSAPRPAKGLTPSGLPLFLYKKEKGVQRASALWRGVGRSPARGDSCSKSVFLVSSFQCLLLMDDVMTGLFSFLDWRRKARGAFVQGAFWMSCFAFADESIDVAQVLQPPPMMDLHSGLQKAMELEDFWSVIDYAEAIARYYPDSLFAHEAAYQCGETYFKMGQYELANAAFSKYLNQPGTIKHFEEVIHYKFTMAELFRNGLKMRLFDSHKLPRWAPSEEGAIALYDEVITTVPHEEIAAQSLWGKGKLQVVLEDFKDSIDTFQTLIRRFPKHDLAVQAYLEINQTYLQQCKTEHLDLDLLDLAEMNFRKFQLAFPREPRLETAEKALTDMQQLYANNLLETGRYYEKVKKIPASIIYYNKVVSKYPDTEAAEQAQKKLAQLQPNGNV